MASADGPRLGVDVGGTFTDLVLVAPDGRALTRKVLSTIANYADAIIDGATALLAEAGVSAASVTEVIHGTTVATTSTPEPRAARPGLRAHHHGRLPRPPRDRAPETVASLRSRLRAPRSAGAAAVAARGDRADEPCRRGRHAARCDQRRDRDRPAPRRGRRVD